MRAHTGTHRHMHTHTHAARIATAVLRRGRAAVPHAAWGEGGAHWEPDFPHCSKPFQKFSSLAQVDPKKGMVSGGN